MVLTVGLVSYVLILRLVRSRASRAMVALRENEALAASVGVDVTRNLVLATLLSASIAGAAGVFYAHYVRIVDPDIYRFFTVIMIIMVISGGKGTLAGPIVGGLIFGLLPEGMC